MEGFLRKVSDYIFSNYGEKIEDLCIVVPNRRAGLFIKKNLATHSKGPIWSPTIFSIEDFIWELAGNKKADLAEQLYIFYSVYKESEKEKAESFEDFCKWAPTLLNDFNEADIYLVDTEQLFGNLSDIRGIEEWSLGQQTLTEFQKQYLHFWASITKWYKLYKKKLNEENLAYPGLAYRYVAENIVDLVEKKQWVKIIFAGFNALNGAEEKIFASLREKGNADLLWDSDSYYLDNKANEAGKFLRKYKKEYFKQNSTISNAFEHIENIFSTETKNITVIAVAKMVSQAKAAAHFLETIDPQTKYSPATAIVLGDEQLLLPLLHTLPKEAENINITMGFPLRNTPIASLVNALFQLHLSAERFNIHTKNGELKYYHTDLSRIFRHPYTKQLLAESKLAEKLDSYIGKKNIIFSSASQLQSFVPETKDFFEPIANLLKPWATTNLALDGLSYLIEILRPIFTANIKVPGDTSLNLDLEYLFQLNLIVKRARSLHEKWNLTNDIRSLKSLIDQQLAATSLPFFGEPLAGLQIMGLLETRTLDFENVILLSANEAIIPTGKSQQSFIIYDLRKYFGMPVWNDKDAASAYHFYRLLQRAKNIFIIYNTDQDIFGSREKSRFVTQLLYELPEVNKNIKITEVVFDAGIPITSTTPTIISIPKTDAINARIENLVEKGMSPSSLNSYRDCKLRFYFHYIAHLREPKEVLETIGADTLGTIIHEALKILYEPAIGTILTVPFLNDAKKKVTQTCESLFKSYFKSDGDSHGKNLLAKKIAIKYIHLFLKAELNKVNSNNKNHVSGIELKMNHEIEVAGRTIKLIGTADRIDKTDYQITLIDYKTGKVETNELKVEDWTDIQTNTKIGKSFQLLMYSWLYARMHKSDLPIASGIISFRKLSTGFMQVKTPDGDLILPSTLANFEDSLRELVGDLLNRDIEFSQTEDLKNCTYCDFKGICSR